MSEIFDVSEFMADQGLEPFPFRDKDGTVWELPHIGLFTAADADKLLAGAFEEIIDKYSDEGTSTAFVSTPAVALNALAHAWFAHCGIEFDENGALKAGKSSPFSPPSRATARASKRTSASGASKIRRR